MRKATPYQVRALEYLQGSRNAFLYMEMRLGKTLPAIRHAVATGSFPCIILAPAPTHGSWCEELELEGVHPSRVALWGTTKRAQRDFGGADFCIVTYQSARLRDLLHLRQWKLRVYDESYMLAKPSSRIASYVREAWQGGVQHIALSGNPAAETELDYVNQFLCVQGSFGKYRTPWDFYLDFCKRDEYGSYVPKKQATLRNIVSYVRKKAFCLTRKDAGVGSVKKHIHRYCDIPAPLVKRYGELIRGEALTYFSRVRQKQMEYTPVTKALHLAMFCSGIDPDTHKVVSKNKLQAAKEIIDIELAGHQVILFSRYKSEVEAAAKYFNCPYIHGDVSRPEQVRIRLDFLQGKSQVVALSVDTCKMGLNFSSATAAIYLSNSFSGDVRAQSEDRVIHIGKSEDRVIVDLVCRHGVDEYISRLVKDKTIRSKADLAQRAVAQARRI